MNVSPDKPCLHLLHSTQVAIVAYLKSVGQQNVFTTYVVKAQVYLSVHFIKRHWGVFFFFMKYPKRWRFYGLTFAKTVEGRKHFFTSDK